MLIISGQQKDFYQIPKTLIDYELYLILAICNKFWDLPQVFPWRFRTTLTLYQILRSKPHTKSLHQFTIYISFPPDVAISQNCIHQFTVYIDFHSVLAESNKLATSEF